MIDTILAKALSDDPLLCTVARLAEFAHYSVTNFAGRGEFPKGCDAARVTGPHLPQTGLPFCVPEHHKEVWAVRVAAALGAAFFAGMCKANSLTKSEYALWAHELARLIVSEVRTSGPDDEKIVKVALMIRGDLSLTERPDNPEAQQTGGVAKP